MEIQATASLERFVIETPYLTQCQCHVVICSLLQSDVLVTPFNLLIQELLHGKFGEHSLGVLLLWVLQGFGEPICNQEASNMILRQPSLKQCGNNLSRSNGPHFFSGVFSSRLDLEHFRCGFCFVLVRFRFQLLNLMLSFETDPLADGTEVVGIECDAIEIEQHSNNLQEACLSKSLVYLVEIFIERLLHICVVSKVVGVELGGSLSNPSIDDFFGSTLEATIGCAVVFKVLCSVRDHHKLHMNVDSSTHSVLGPKVDPRRIHHKDSGRIWSWKVLERLKHPIRDTGVDRWDQMEVVASFEDESAVEPVHESTLLVPGDRLYKTEDQKGDHNADGNPHFEQQVVHP